MTSVFGSDGVNIAVTVIEAGPCIVTQVKSADTKDGYKALQLSFGERKEKNTPNAKGVCLDIAHRLVELDLQD